jgi:hypothetical protein
MRAVSVLNNSQNRSGPLFVLEQNKRQLVTFAERSRHPSSIEGFDETKRMDK